MKRYLQILCSIPVLLLGTGILLHFAGQGDDTMQIPCATEEERTGCLAAYGWEAEAAEHRTIQIPAITDGISETYAALQEQQKLPFSGFCGKEGEAYTYSIPEKELYAELLVSDGILAGAYCYPPDGSAMLTLKGEPFPAPAGSTG